MNKLGVLVIALAACKGGDKDKGGGGGADGKTGCVTKAAKVADLVTSKTPGFLAPFTGLKLGMSRDEVAKLCPNFFADADVKGKTGNFSTGEIVGQFGKDSESYAQARLEFIADKLDSISFSLPPAIGDALAAQWGAPKVSSGAKPGHAWFDEATKTRAILGPPEYDTRRALEVSSYMPLDAFIEHETTRIAWKPQDVLGKKADDLAKTFPQYKKAVETSAAVKAKTDEMMKELDKEVAALGVKTKRDKELPEFELPATPYADGRATHVILYDNDDGTVRSYGVWFRTASISPEMGWPQQSADIKKLLDDKWGKPKQVTDMIEDEWRWYDPKQGIYATTRIQKPEKPEELDLVYVRYLPLDTFFGAPGTAWGFEKAERPLIGATADEVKAAYKDYAPKVADDGSTVTLYLPPTDYAGSNAQTSILCFVRNGKIGDFRFDLPYGPFATARAEYEAALEKKLGAPGKTSKYGETPYGKITKVRFSDITKNLDVIVGEK